MDVKDIAEFIKYQGVSTVVVCILLWFMVKYAPRLVKAHTEFVDSTAATQISLAKASEIMSESMRIQGHDYLHVKKALSHLVDAARVSTDCREVHHHLDLAKQKLDVMAPSFTSK